MTSVSRWLAVALVGLWPLSHAPAAPPAPWISPGPAVPRVTLLDHEGRGWRLDELVRDRAVVVSFFFTGCFTLCPTQTAMLRDLHEELTRRGRTGASGPLLLSISVDPVGDSPASVKAYAERFEARLGATQGWMMLTGPVAALAKVWAAFDASVGQPTDHAALIWVGQPGQRRWTRASALAPVSAVADLLLEDPH